MTDPHAIITESPPDERGRSLILKCSFDGCRYTAYTWAPNRVSGENLINNHLNQHQPDRALDIEVSYHVDADCSVCDDGGRVDYGDDGDIECAVCGTYWDGEGKGGMRYEV